MKLSKKEAASIWYINNKELTKKRALEWSRVNKSKRKIIRDKWRSANLEKAREIERISHSKNKEKKAIREKLARSRKPGMYASYVAIRRALKLQRTPKWLTTEHYFEIRTWYELAKELQWLSEAKLHVDHIVPLSGKNVSGLHVPWNLQILPQPDNNKKTNKHDSD